MRKQKKQYYKCGICSCTGHDIKKFIVVSVDVETGIETLICLGCCDWP